jgi:tetratricopeptide (TPR) repeat protein
MDLCYEGIQAGHASEAYFAAMRARHILDTEDWSLASRWTAELGNGEAFWQRAAVIDQFTNAFAAVRTGDPAPARAFVNAYGGSEDEQQLVHALELSGLLAIEAGQTDRGIELLQDAAALEDSLPFEFGPPVIVKPSFELLGEELLKLERYEEARAAFQRATERTPGRTLAVRGLEAAAASGG